MEPGPPYSTPYQEAIGGVDGHAAGEGVMDGQGVHVGGGRVASSLVHVSAAVEVQRVAALLLLLAHVLQLHLGHMHRGEVAQDL